MALDTSIFAQYLRPVKSVADYDLEYQGQQRNALLLDQARQQQAAAAQKMQMDREAAMRDEAESNALARVLPTIDLKTPEGQNALRIAAPNKALPYLKEYAETQGKFATADKSAADAVKTRGEALDKALSRNRDLLNFVQTPQQAAYWAAAAYQDPDLAPIMQRIAPDPEAFARGIPQDPKSFADWRVAGVSSVDKLRDLVRQEMAQAETARHNKAGEQIQTRVQDLTNQRAREGLALQRERFKYEQGRDAVADKERAAGAGPAGAAKLSAAQEREQADLRKAGRQSEQMIAAIGEARTLLKKGPTASGVGALIDAAGRGVGMSSQSAQVAGQLETLAGWMVANVPRMEGPQSNFDVENYKTMAAKVGNREVPVSERVAALDTLEKLHRKYAEINGTALPPGGPAPARVVDFGSLK